MDENDRTVEQELSVEIRGFFIGTTQQTPSFINPEKVPTKVCYTTVVDPPLNDITIYLNITVD